ncbi:MULTISPECIES: alpha/beta fold hydrolase [unclassified Afipia]|uniref:alpha/beta hydrolase family protein n=1 Tax=unclassified Afipia TaxID=2642050 RepID=UPI000429B294|nr:MULTISPECIES: alpha/beta fold hydrolase [unclassified Afipia]
MTKNALFKVASLLLAVGVLPQTPAWGENQLGARGGEGTPNRRQEWLVPTQDQITPSRAVLFRPAGKGPFRLAVIAHASTQNRLARAQMPQPEYPALAAALVARGFAVLVPQRLGHGKTGGPYLEDQEGCDNAEYTMSARTTGETITAALTFMRTQPFIRKDASVIVGHSAGGWGALALADQSPKSISSIVVFAPGRGGRKDDRANSICAPDKLIAGAKEFGEDAQVPVTWLVAENDSYFPPEFSKKMADAFIEAGDDKVDFQVLPPFGKEGHWLAEAGEEGGIGALLPVQLSPPAIGAATKR